MMLDITTTPTLTVNIYDDDGLPRTGLVAATFPPVNWRPDGVGAASTITPVDLASLAAAWTVGGVFEIGDGKYRLDAPAALASSRRNVQLWGEETDKRLICPVLEVGNWPKIDLIGTADIEIIGPVATDGDSITLFVGGSYLAATGNALEWSLASPSLSGYTVNFGLGLPVGPTVITKTGTVVDAGLSTQKVRVELTAAETAALAGHENKAMIFTIVGVSGSTRLPLISGSCLVRRNYAA